MRALDELREADKARAKGRYCFGRPDTSGEDRGGSVSHMRQTSGERRHV